MSPSSRSRSSARSPKVVRPVHIMIGAFWMALLLAGAVLQTHLRFSERDFEIQMRRHQEELALLRDERRELETQIDRLRSSEGVRQRAQENLGLMAATPSLVHRLEIDDALWVKYAGSSPAGRLNHATTAPGWMDMLPESRRSSAREVSQNPAKP